MFTILGFVAATIAPTVTLAIEGCVTTITIYGVCKGSSKITSRYSFKH